MSASTDSYANDLDELDAEPITERFASAPPISLVRAIVRDDEPTLHSYRRPTLSRGYAVAVGGVSALVLFAMLLDRPWPQVLGVLSATLSLSLLARGPW